MDASPFTSGVSGHEIAGPEQEPGMNRHIAVDPMPDRKLGCIVMG